MKEIRRIARQLIVRCFNRSVSVDWINKNDEKSTLQALLLSKSMRPPKSKFSRRIETIADQTNALGALPLWDGYGEHNVGGLTRAPDEIRTSASLGDLYTLMVVKAKPKVIVEFGSGFGVSGMFFLAGLEMNSHGRLFTFEVNSLWAEIARKNLEQISDRFQLTVGTFEDNIDSVLPVNDKIDLAFVDGIHTEEFVDKQVGIILERSRSGTIILVDDVNFSRRMKEFWEFLSRQPSFSASATLGLRVGALEVK